VYGTLGGFDKAELFGGTFLDDAGGGFGVVRAESRDEAAAMLAADPAITEGVMTGVVRRWTFTRRSSSSNPAERNRFLTL
jgi:hypothetical protein